MRGRRGMGLMQGLELDASVAVGTVVSNALTQGLVILSAGGNVLRFLPPLVITQEDIDDMATRLEAVFSEIIS